MKHMPRWLSPLALSLMAVSALSIAPGARAEAPQAQTQAPGYYRQMLGAFEVTALYDGYIPLDTKILKGATPQELQKRLAAAFRSNPTQTAVNAYLVNTGSKLVLVDAGAAKFFGPTLGQVPANLKAAGYDPSQVDAVVITHLHGDHIGGVLGADGQAAFPKADVYVDKADADYWLSADAMAKAPEDMRKFFKMAQDATAPYVKSGHLKTFQGQTEIVPGLKTVDQHGHTPGHTGYLFESQGQKLLVWGDVVHNAAVQFSQPKVTIEFDSDQPKARAARLKLFDWLSKEGVLVGGAHLAFPGLGHIRAEGKGGYAWVPVDFSPVLPAAPKSEQKTSP